MTEKKPEIGEWWELNNDRVLIVGKTRNGIVIAEYQDGSVYEIETGENFKHLPDCDSFDWKPEPVESPDDWVTQDVVYDRPGIDQWRRVLDGIPDDWRWSSEDEACYMHGHTALSGRSVFEVRCRRKDLPVMPEQTQKREYVRILINQARGSVSIVHGDCDIVLEGCDEVRHDGTGFYLADGK